jgi:hypothetical protein
MPAPTIEHALNADDVKAIYAGLLAQQKTPKEAHQGTRTAVHALLKEDNPLPLPLDPPAREYNLAGIVIRDGFKVGDEALADAEAKAKDVDTAARKAALHARVSAEDILESERARGGPDGAHRDAVHYVQKRHGMALWKEADRLVLAAIGGVPA